MHQSATASQSSTNAYPILKPSMTPRLFLELPGEIRNNIYRNVLCYDGITPEVRSPWSPWNPCALRTRRWESSLSMRQDSCTNLATERSHSRMQLNVMAPVRKGFYPGLLPLVLASDVLSLLRVCRQVYEEAHPIFWAENAFIFSDQDTRHRFLHRISAKSFQLIRTLGVEKTVNAEWIKLANGEVLRGRFADARIPPLLQPLHLSWWTIQYEEYICLRNHWVADYSNPSELKMRKFLIRCKTTYNWLRWPSTSEMERIQDTSGVTGDGLHNMWAMKT